MAETEAKKIKKVLIGTVTKLSSEQTIKVRIETKKAHSKYGKVIKSHRNFLVHAETTDEVKVGDRVRITEAKPISKTKFWVFVSKVK
jgi:small subunit ribosomal protein S17